MYKYLFGPIPSRRLGISLGVDLVTHKICSLDCVYCECGKTTQLTLERKEYVPYKKVIEELEHYFAHHSAPDHITFSGSGEPTLNSKIGDVIDYIKTGVATNAVSVAVLTNGTLLGDESVRNSLLRADLVIPSLDAASISAFKQINRPHKDISLTAYIQGLVEFRSVYKGKMALEILILPGFNDSHADLELLKDACYRINPDVVQLNTLDRPGTIANLTPASIERLEAIKAFIQSGQIANSIQVETVASAPKREESRAYRKDMESAILGTIHRRPCTVEDLSSILGSDINQINRYLSTMEQSGKIISVLEQRGVFYHSVKQ